MALKIVVIVAAALILLMGFVGFRRDLRRGVMTLAGTLVGAIMVGFWSDRWGQSLADRLGGSGDPAWLTFVVSSSIFLFCALVVGYGGGMLLGPKERAPFQRRLVGALLGLLNGVLVAAYLLRFGAAGDGSLREMVQDWLPARLLLDGLPLLFLIVTVGIGLLVVVRLLLSLGGYAPAAQTKPTLAASQQKSTPTAPSSAAASGSAAPQPSNVGDHDVLSKVNDALRR
jgi:uncharacterized membrane protein required for colicin V production